VEQRGAARERVTDELAELLDRRIVDHRAEVDAVVPAAPEACEEAVHLGTKQLDRAPRLRGKQSAAALGAGTGRQGAEARHSVMKSLGITGQPSRSR
jgi:hypothetical protein